jgi:hypothetical protein
MDVSARATCPKVASPAKKATAPPTMLLLPFTAFCLAERFDANLGEACGVNASAPALMVANNATTLMLLLKNELRKVKIQDTMPIEGSLLSFDNKNPPEAALYHSYRGVIHPAFSERGVKILLWREEKDLFQHAPLLNT